MREQATLSRRTLAAALPFAALMSSTAAAVPAPAISDDATLLDLGRQWQVVHLEHVAHWRAWQALSRAEQDRRGADLEAECETLSHREWALEADIHALQATTIAGLAVKARIAARVFDVEDLDIASIERACEQQCDCQAHAALSLALDILRLARTAV